MNDPSANFSPTPRAEPQPVLLYGGVVLTMDAQATVIPDAEVLIQQGRIAALGRAITAPPGTRLVDVQGTFILPGLIQGHVHLGQTFFRGLAERRPLLAWLRERIWPLEAAHSDESAYWCTLLGASECLLSGTTTVQDIGLGPGARGLLQALVESRLRAIAGKCLMDDKDHLPPGLVEDTDQTLSHSEALGDEFDRAGDGRLRYAVNPRFILSCSDALWNGVQQLAERRKWPVHTHALEQREEGELIRSIKNGRDEIEYFDSQGVLDTDLRIAHGVWLSEEHRQRVQGRRFSIVHCPGSNLKLGSGIADIIAMKSSSIPVGLGCDGAACNNTLDAFQEIRLSAQLQSVQRGPGSFSGLDALRLATSEGARALNMHDEIGSIEVGKRADLIVLDGDRAGLWSTPYADPHDLVAFGASGHHVKQVYIDGDQLVDGGKLTHLDIGRVKHQAYRTSRDLLQRSGITF